MVKVLFVCHGNICRSTMAESLFFHLVRSRGLEKEIFVSSAATHCDELGNPPYPDTVRELNRHHVAAVPHRARLLTRADGEEYDYIVGMDEENLAHMLRILGREFQNKIFLLLDFTPSPRPISDPWYTRDFKRTYEDVEAGCNALLDRIENALRS